LFSERRTFVLAVALILAAMSSAFAQTPTPLPPNTSIVPGVDGDRLQVRSGVLRYCPTPGKSCASVRRISRITLPSVFRRRGISGEVDLADEVQNSGETWAGATADGFSMRGDGNRILVVLRRAGRPIAAAEASTRSIPDYATVRVLAGRGSIPTTVWVASHDGDLEYEDTPESGPLVGFAVFASNQPRVVRQRVFEHLLVATGYSKVLLSPGAPRYRYCRAHPRPPMPHLARGGDIVVTTPGQRAFVEHLLRWNPARSSFDDVETRPGRRFPAVPRCVDRLDRNVVCWIF